MPHRTPAALERVRIPIARWLITNRPLVRWGLNLVPNSHPFKTFAASTYEDLDEFADLALRSRNKNGTPRIAAPWNRRTRRRAFAIAVVGYLAVAQLVTTLPAVVVYHGPGKIAALEALGLVDKPIKAPRLRIHLTTNELPK